MKLVFNKDENDSITVQFPRRFRNHRLFHILGNGKKNIQ